MATTNTRQALPARRPVLRQSHVPVKYRLPSGRRQFEKPFWVWRLKYERQMECAMRRSFAAFLNQLGAGNDD